MAGKKDAMNDRANKPRLSLIPREAILEMGKALTHGEERYGTHNYKEGIKLSLLIDAAMRHILQFNEGEDTDEQSGTSHIGCAMANLAMLLYIYNNKPVYDDRFVLGPTEKTEEIKEETKKLNLNASYTITENDMMFFHRGTVIVKSDGTKLRIETDGTFPVKKGDAVYASKLFKAHHNLNDIRMVMKAIMLNEQNDVVVKFKKLYNDVTSPLKTSPFNAGVDLYTYKYEEYENYVKVYTGVAVQSVNNFYFLLAPRSSIYKHGLIMHNGIGIIDKNYSGELIGIFYKTKDYKGISVGERLMQLIPQKCLSIELIEVNELNDTDRNANGLGSTGA